ncbi:MAG: DNA recombination protein RmuC [Firmicutes bacterium]|nr:DNA recombination protein RmuC [Bacillota bacterium]
MDAVLILVIISVIMSGICALLLAAQYLIKPRRNMDIGDAVKKTEQQFSQLLGMVERENEHMLRIYRESNALLAERISQYNTEVSKSVENAGKFQREAFEGVENRLKEVLSSNETRLERINKNVTENLSKMQQTVDEKLNETLEKRLNQSLLGISERLESVFKGLGEMQQLAAGVGDLKKVLSNVKVRGTWGEVQLGNLLEQMLAPNQYAAQVKLGKDENSRVDYAVVMPGKDDGVVYLPLDSKFPMDSYERLVLASEAGDIAAIEKAAKEIESRVKNEAKKISAAYIKTPVTTDFAIMYIPIEGLFAEVVKKQGLIEQLQSEYRIMVCGPTTLSALLNSLQMGFRTMAIEQRSSEIWALLSMFRSEFGKFTDLLAKTQKKLSEASSTIEDATKKTAKISKGLAAVQTFEPKGNESFNLVNFGDDEKEE